MVGEEFNLNSPKQLGAVLYEKLKLANPKKKSTNAETLEKELSVTKQKKIVKTSKCFLLEYRQYKYDYIRYDVVVVDMPGQEPIWHIENAFSEYS